MGRKFDFGISTYPAWHIGRIYSDNEYYVIHIGWVWFVTWRQRSLKDE